MPIFIFLHVLTMFVAIAMAYGTAMLMVVASRGRDVRALRGISRTYEKLARLVIPTFSIGITFGFVAIFVHNFDPLLGWLVLAYVLVVASIVMTVVFSTPWLKSVQVAADASPEDAASPQLLELVNSPRDQAGLIIVALIADMVLKPLPDRLF